MGNNRRLPTLTTVTRWIVLPLVAAGLGPGCGGSAQSVEERVGPTQRIAPGSGRLGPSSRAAQAIQTLHDHCVEQVQPSGRTSRDSVENALVALSEAYRGAPSWSRMGRDRNALVDAITQTQARLKLCDPDVARDLARLVSRLTGSQ